MTNKNSVNYTRRLMATLAIPSVGPLPIAFAQAAAGDTDWCARLENCQLYAILRRPALRIHRLAKVGETVWLFARSSAAATLDTVAIGLNLKAILAIGHNCLKPGVNVLASEDAVSVTCHCGLLEQGDEMFWASIDSLAQDHRSRGPWTRAFRRSEYVATYETLYVGSAPKRDALRRVFASGHHALQKVLLAAEDNRESAVLLALFSIERSLLQAVVEDGDEYVRPDEWGRAYDHVSAVVEIEKALIHALRPQFNGVLYASYPRGSGGLNRSALDELVVTISSPVVLRGSSMQWVGGLGLRQGKPTVLRVTGDSLVVGQGAPLDPGSMRPGVYELS